MILFIEKVYPFFHTKFVRINGCFVNPTVQMYVDCNAILIEHWTVRQSIKE